MITGGVGVITEGLTISYLQLTAQNTQIKNYKQKLVIKFDLYFWSLG